MEFLSFLHSASDVCKLVLAINNSAFSFSDSASAGFRLASSTDV